VILVISLFRYLFYHSFHICVILFAL